MNQSFYGKVRAEGYDIGTDVREISDFYLDQWQKLAKPTPVLEPMCGTGLHLVPFLQAGAKVDGLDSSPHMLKICRQKIAAQGFTANLYEQVLESMTLPQQYAFIFIPDRSFGHIHDQATARIGLERIWEHLLPDGWFILDVKCPGQLSTFGQPGQAEFGVKDRPDGSTIFSTSVWGDVEDGRVIRCWTKYERYVEGQLADTEIFDYRERLYERTEFEEMLTAAGFRDIMVVRAYENVEPGANDGMVFTCRKVQS